ncbi:hypothetical protein [Georgenia sp. AZ-5]|uniref:hypothetical protein n=1 Tax=Georgenia sp. AZ-5 TaxID=3367526 RepID=UPI003753F74E
MPVPFQAPPAPIEPAAHTLAEAASRGPKLPFGVIGSGFLPGEEVAFAVVVATAPADAQGLAEVPLPPALLTRLPEVIVLFGRTSGTLVVHDPTDQTLAAGAV